MEPPCTGGPKHLHGSIGTYRKFEKMKILLKYRLWSKCVPVDLKRTPTGADPGYVKRGGRDPKGGAGVADITRK